MVGGVHHDQRPLRPAPLAVVGARSGRTRGSRPPRAAARRGRAGGGPGLGLAQQQVVAVEVRAGVVASASGRRAVRVCHRHDPQVHVARQALRILADPADQLEQRVLAGRLVAVLLADEQHAPALRRAGRRGRGEPRTAAGRRPTGRSRPRRSSRARPRSREPAARSQRRLGMAPRHTAADRPPRRRSDR